MFGKNNYLTTIFKPSVCNQVKSVFVTEAESSQNFLLQTTPLEGHNEMRDTEICTLKWLLIIFLKTHLFCL